MFGMNFTVNGESIFKKLARDKRMINYYDLFFQTGDRITKNFVF